MTPVEKFSQTMSALAMSAFTNSRPSTVLRLTARLRLFRFAHI